jgi:hypothetical protein
VDGDGKRTLSYPGEGLINLKQHSIIQKAPKVYLLNCKSGILLLGLEWVGLTGVIR